MGVIDKVLEFAKYNESKPHWKIFYGDDPAKKGRMAATSDIFIAQNGELSAQKSYEKLGDALKLLPTGPYCLIVKENEKDNNGMLYYPFSIGNPEINGGHYQQPVHQSQGMTMETFRELMRANNETTLAQINNMRQEFVIEGLKNDVEKLKREVKEAAKKKPSEAREFVNETWDKFLQAKAMFDKDSNTNFRGTKVGIAGGGEPIPAKKVTVTDVIPNAEEDLTAEEQEALNKRAQAVMAKLQPLYQKAFKEMSERRGDSIKAMTDIILFNEFAKDKPAVFDSYHPMLLQYLDKIEVDGLSEFITGD